MSNVEICISSDVVRSYILAKKGDVYHYLFKAGFEILNNNNWVAKFNDKALLLLYNTIRDELKIKIDKDNFSNKSDQIRYTEYSYNGRKIYLNLSESIEFEVALLIDLEKIIDRTKHFGGTMHIFNRTELKKYRNGSVLAVLKTGNGFTINALKQKFAQVSLEFKSFEPITDEHLMQSLDSLMQFGLVDTDNELAYHLTGRGRIIVI